MILMKRLHKLGARERVLKNSSSVGLLKRKAASREDNGALEAELPGLNLLYPRGTRKSQQ